MPDVADNPDKALKVYYNSACPVCSSGINAQRNRMLGCDVAWNDVHSDPTCRDDLRADLEFVRKRLHVVDEQGNTRIGIDAFISLWRMSPGERRKARFFSLPIVHLLAVWAYNAFAFCLYKWNKALKHW